MNKRIITFFALAAVFIVVFTSCTQERDDGFRWGYTTEPDTFDPLNPSNTADGRSILFNVFEGLVKPDTDGTLLPCIAESWTVEQDGLIYTFTIREGLQFHDNSKVTPADIKFSLDTAITKGFIGLDNIKEVVIQNGKQVQVILKSVDPDFLPYLTVGIVKSGNTDREKNIIGTGPFIVESYTPKRKLILKKFYNYRQRGLPFLEKITVLFFANYDTLMVALRGGSIDGTFITGAMAAQLDHRQFDIISNRSAAVQLLALNNAFPPLDDIRVRQAINYGVDVRGIIDSAFFSSGEPSGSPIIPGLSVYYEKSLSYSHNPDLARSLLSQAGYNNTNKLSLEITAPSNYTMHVDTAQVIVNQLENIGINAKIKLVDWPAWLSEVYAKRNYQATIISLDSPSVSPRSFLTRYRTGSGDNFINFSNVEFDNAYDATLTENDNEKRIGFYKEAQRIIAENAASVFIQDIHYFITLRKGAYGGALDYPLYVIDFASIYEVEGN
jgi:peptide/nickel transport system substrate-binding protein